MAANYPSNVKSFDTKVDYVNTVFAAHVNELQDEVSAIEAILGQNVHVSTGWTGSFDSTTTTWASVKARLQNIEYGLKSAYTAKIPSGGTSGQTLVKNSSSDYDVSWGNVSSIPSQAGNAGKILTTDGSNTSWVNKDSLHSFLLAGC